MHFLVFFPHPVVHVVPILNGCKIISELLQDPYVILVADDDDAFAEQVCNLEQESANCIILLVAPLLMELGQVNWVISCMDILERMLWLVAYGKINFVFVLQENVKHGRIGFPEPLSIINFFQAQSLIDIIP